jgi:Recombinase zinc beta ribbon domain
MKIVDSLRSRLRRPSRRPNPTEPSVEEADVFLPDRLPAYISLEQYQRNQAQIQSNRAAWGGAVLAGSALLSGVVSCGRCGLRMNAQYNNNGHTARYACINMKLNYGEPFCQSLTAAPLDALLTRLILQALQPAALEASIALASDLEAERTALDRQWQHRLERARLSGRAGLSGVSRRRTRASVGGPHTRKCMGKSISRTSAIGGGVRTVSA